MYEFLLLLAFSLFAFFTSPSCRCCITTEDCSSEARDVCDSDLLCATLQVTFSGTAPTSRNCGTGDSGCDFLGTYCLDVLCGSGVCIGHDPSGVSGGNEHAWSFGAGNFAVTAWIFKNTSDSHYYFRMVVFTCVFDSPHAACGAGSSWYRTNDIDLGTTAPDCTSLNLSGSGGLVSPNAPITARPCDMGSASQYSWTAACVEC